MRIYVTHVKQIKRKIKNRINVMKKIFLLLNLVLCAFFYAQTKYKGVGFQKEIFESWDLEIVKINNNEYSVKYPSIPCTAKWKLIKQENNYLIYKEELLTGFDNCINNSIIFFINDNSSPTTKRFYIFNKIGDEKPYAYGYLELVQ